MSESPIVRARRSDRTFSFVDEKKKKEEKERKERPERERGGRNGAHIIMDPTIEKSETSRREVHERQRVRIYAYIRVCVHASECGGPPARDVLFRSATNGPRRLPFNDYKCVRDTCNAFIHYHLPFPNRLRVASYN